MRLPAELCKMQRKKRETDGFSKSTLMTPPGSHPTSGFGARHGLPKFFRHKKRRIVQNDAANWWTRRGSNPRPLGCEPNALPAISLLCTPYALREKKNQRIFVYIKCSAIQTTFLARKYGLQAADFQDEAVWGVIWLADK